MKPIFRCFLFALAVLLPLWFALAQDSGLSLSVQGEVQKPSQWTMEQLKSQFAGQVQKVNFTGKDKQPKVGTGIPVLSAIQAAALKTDPSINHHDLKFFVILEAKDSYQAFFSLAELTPTQGRSPQAFLIWDIDEKPLPDTETPLRLILTAGGDARQIHAVTKIILVDGVKLAKQLKERDKQ
jgi:DMSO/TMAO reductase YedYZ molybdopterin-dependent catalytic subunit